MQYIEMVKLGLMALSLLVDLVKDLKGEEGDSDTMVDRGTEFLSKLGETANIKELKGLDLGAIAPELKALVKKLAELKALTKNV